MLNRPFVAAILVVRLSGASEEETGNDVPMRARRALRATALGTAALVAGVLASPAGAGLIADRLSRARSERDDAQAVVASLRSQAPELRARLGELERRAGQATIAVLDAIGAEQAATSALAAARNAFDARARAAFEFGPAATIDAMLAAESLAEVSAVNEFAGRTLAADADSLAAVEAARVEITRARAQAEAAQREADRRESVLEAEAIELEGRLDVAVVEARAAGVKVRDLVLERNRLRKMRERQLTREQNLAAVELRVGGGTSDISVDSKWFDGRNQDDLLALLGPTGGRMCSTPTSLKDTGERISGDATWYGWDFAGQSTASGATFDPRLFTAAHRTLPFGSFLRVHYGHRCVIVLVNDRGPYGDYDRIIDLSQAAARALGSESAGVVHVTADILVPR
jgi:rare lipoprotein A